MSRKVIIIIFIVCIALFTCVWCSWADEAADIEQVKKVLYRYEEGVFGGDAKKIKSCFASDFVAYGIIADSLTFYTFQGGNSYIDPEDMYVVGIGADFIQKHAEQFSYYPEYLKKHPDYIHTTKVSHVHVNGTKAFAVTRHLRRWNDENARENIFREHRTVWMLSKTREEWKVTSFIGPVTSLQSVLKMRPPR